MERRKATNSKEKKKKMKKEVRAKKNYEEEGKVER